MADASPHEASQKILNQDHDIIFAKNDGDGDGLKQHDSRILPNNNPLDDGSIKNKLVANFIDQQKQELISKETFFFGKISAFLLFEPAFKTLGVSSEKATKLLINSLENDVRANFSEALKKGFSLEELQILARLHHDNIVSRVEETKSHYFTQRTEDIGDRENRKEYEQLLAVEQSPQRIALIEKIEHILGEADAFIQQQNLIAEIYFQGTTIALSMEDKAKSKADEPKYKQSLIKDALACYDTLSDADLKKYFDLIEKHPVLIKEQKALQASKIEASRHFAQAAHKILIDNISKSEDLRLIYYGLPKQQKNP